MKKKATTKRDAKRKSERPPSRVGDRARIETFVQQFFRKGAQLTEELLQENDQLRRLHLQLEAENTKLRTQLASDHAMRDLLRKIKQLEKEKGDLLSHVHEAEMQSTRFGARFHEMEEELAKLANLYVASYQLHSTLDVQLVVRHLKELLQQLVGAQRVAIYMADSQRKYLLLVASEQIDEKKYARIPLGGDEVGHMSVAERVFLTGTEHIAQGALGKCSEKSPAAVIPLRFDDRVVGVIMIHSVFEQKTSFGEVDFELFKMLGAHAASALVGAMLYASAEARLPDAT
ncbi:MAG TPA: GAF domain-containing protein, partial [Polyangiaceae bacterium]|nr:GAF domain-containing protein [Polyangiaceae bacterium]